MEYLTKGGSMGKQALRSREMLNDKERRELQEASKREKEKQRDKERKEKFRFQGRE